MRAAVEEEKENIKKYEAQREALRSAYKEAASKFE